MREFSLSRSVVRRVRGTGAAPSAAVLAGTAYRVAVRPPLADRLAAGAVGAVHDADRVLAGLVGVRIRGAPRDDHGQTREERSDPEQDYRVGVSLGRRGHYKNPILSDGGGSVLISCRWVFFYVSFPTEVGCTETIF